MTEEHKQKIREGRERARKEKEALGIPTRNSKGKKLKGFKSVVGDKPVLYITGEEKTGFDFWEPLRKLYRPVASWVGKKIEREIVDPKIWRNVGIIKDILSKYVHIEIKESNKKKKEKKERKKRAPMSEEQKAKMAEILKKAREARKKKD